MSPGLPAALPSIVALPTPPGVTIWAIARWLLPVCSATTVAFEPVRAGGMVKPALSVPLRAALPRATMLPLGECGDRSSNTVTAARGVKPLPSMLTWPPGATMPGLRMMTGPPPAATGWPPSVTVGTGVGRGAGAVLLTAEWRAAVFPLPSVTTWKICQMITSATAMPRIDFHLPFFLRAETLVKPPPVEPPSLTLVKPGPVELPSLALVKPDPVRRSSLIFVPLSLVSITLTPRLILTND